MSIELQTKVREVSSLIREGNGEQFMNKHRSYSSFGSMDFGSSVESEISSTSTESESDQEEDFLAELTRQMAHSTLQEDDIEQQKPWNSSELQKDENLQRDDEEMNQYFKERFYNTSIKAKQALIDEQIKAIQICKLRQQKIIKEEQHGNFQSKVRSFNGGGVSSEHQNRKVPWSNFQQKQHHRPTGSEMRAVFLDEPGSRAGSSGTGVFLPRGIVSTAESRKKPGCSTVLLPAKVVQALKLHFDKMDVNSRPSVARNFLFQHDCYAGDVRYGLQLRHKSRSETVPASNYSQENGLPHEWTY